MTPLLVGLAMTPLPAYGFLDVIDQLQQELEGGAPVVKDPTAPLQNLLKELDVTTVPTFSDVPSFAWYATYVVTVATWKIVEGYRDATGARTGLFGPGDPVTVAQAVKMALRAAKIDEAKCRGTVLHPQAKGHWAEPFILCAENRKFRIFRNGKPAALDRPVKRGEIVGIIHDGLREQVPRFSSPFSDSKGHPYEADIAYAYLRGVVSGDSDALGLPLWRFRPEDPVTRAEAAKMLYEHLKTIVLNEENAEAVVLDVTTQNHAFTPKTLTARKGQIVTVRFRNTGQHTFTVPDLEISKLLWMPVETLTFVPLKTGLFPFYCAVQGHREKGMMGTLLVK